jgi:predicted enzyme related to lactoylglutathione lyase
MSISLVIYPVTDIARAKEQFTVYLGVAPYVDSPYYVGFKLGDQEVGLAAGKEVLAYLKVPDIKKRVAELVATGATIEQEVKSVGPGRLIATVKDSAGNTLALMQDG